MRRRGGCSTGIFANLVFTFTSLVCNSSTVVKFCFYWKVFLGIYTYSFLLWVNQIQKCYDFKHFIYISYSSASGVHRTNPSGNPHTLASIQYPTLINILPCKNLSHYHSVSILSYRYISQILNLSLS